MSGDRICVECGHVHPYCSPFYRCAHCKVWGQDMYELKPVDQTLRQRLAVLERLYRALLKRCTLITTRSQRKIKP